MRVLNPPSRLITVTPSRGLRIGLLMAAVLICLLVIIRIAFGPMRYDQMVWRSSYQDAPLSRVITDLERAGIIAPGTTWVDPSLKTRAVTVRWLLASPDDVLQDLASQAAIRIEYPCGYHGNMIGPASLSPAAPGGGVVVPKMNRELELRQLDNQRQAPN